ncbi:MAG: hypothetical protein DRP56_10685 [Planctomycetota bacterium]|nr:MAG: hypothetical protein DRP56_10685 [Planctomycetota bacterium]
MAKKKKKIKTMVVDGDLVPETSRPNEPITKKEAQQRLAEAIGMPKSIKRTRLINYLREILA